MSTAQGSSGPGAQPLVAVGDVVHVAEAHYCYGAGPLTMCVTGVSADLGLYPGLEWVQLRGVQIRHDGADGEPRDALVRVAALREAGAVQRASPSSCRR